MAVVHTASFMEDVIHHAYKLAGEFREAIIKRAVENAKFDPQAVEFKTPETSKTVVSMKHFPQISTSIT